MVVAVASSVHAGKTTFIHKLKNYSEYPYDVIVYDEVIRNKNINIDEIRKDSYQYFLFEKEVIFEKIKHELEAAMKSKNNRLIILDRTMADSLYYFNNYIDPSTFDDEQFEDYESVKTFFYRYAGFAFDKIYDEVFLFEPIPIPKKLNDQYRPKGMTREKQQKEFESIKSLIYEFCQDEKLHMFNAKKHTEYQFLKLCKAI